MFSVRTTAFVLLLLLPAAAFGQSQSAEIGHIKFLRDAKFKKKKGLRFEVYNVKVDGMKNQRIHFGFNIREKKKWLVWRGTPALTVQYNPAYWAIESQPPFVFFYPYKELKKKGAKLKGSLEACFYVMATDEDRAINKKCHRFRYKEKSSFARLPTSNPLGGLKAKKKKKPKAKAKPSLKSWGAILSYSRGPQAAAAQLIEMVGKDKMLLFDKAGTLQLLSLKGFKPQWSHKPGVAVNQIATRGTLSFALGYRSKSGERALEIRSLKDGKLKTKHSFVADTSCYGPNAYLKPEQIVYAPGGKKLTVWFHNDRGNKGSCEAGDSDLLVQYDAKSGKQLSLRRYFLSKIQNLNCGSKMRLSYGASEKSLYLATCSNLMVRYQLPRFRIVKKADFSEALRAIIEGRLKQRINSGKFSLDTLRYAPGTGRLLTSWGNEKTSALLAVTSDLKKMSIVSMGKRLNDAFASVSRGSQYLMAVNDQLRIYNTRTKKMQNFKLNGNQQGLIRFHPTKKAIVIANGTSINLIFPFWRETVKVAKGENKLKKYILEGQSYCVRTRGKFTLMYSTDGKKWQSTDVQKNIFCSADLAGASSFKAIAVGINSEKAAEYELFGFYNSKPKQKGFLKTLPSW